MLTAVSTAVRIAAAAGLAGGLLAGCAPQPPGDEGTVSVVAGFYPLQFAAERVGGQRVSVTSLTRPGAEPHDVELTPQQVARIADADLVLYVAGFQPAVDAAIEQEAADRAYDVSAGLERADTGVTVTAGDPASDHADADGTDPHVWLDPANMVTISEGTADRLAAIDPSGRAAYRGGAAGLAAELATLDRSWTRGTRRCASRDLVVSHAAFAYLARAYGFTQVAISGLSPDEEPNPTTIAAVAEFVRDAGVRTVYYETLVDPKVAETVAAEAGVRTAVLDPLEGVPDDSDADYLTLMAANLAAVRAGQPCR